MKRVARQWRRTRRAPRKQWGRTASRSPAPRKTSFIMKCCEDSAVGKDGKPLAGAAKTSFVKKCTSG